MRETVIIGGSVSSTVTVAEQDPVLPDASVAVAVTVVVPTANVDPLAWLLETVAPVQLSDAEVVKVTAASHCPGSLFTVMLAGQVITGFVASTMVTLNEQLLVLPLVSEAVKVTRVTPSGKSSPDCRPG